MLVQWTNVALEDSTREVFSRDCPQFEVQTPSSTIIHVLVNHFKSRSGGGGPKRLRQAKAVRDIADHLVADEQHVVVLGDLNEGPKTLNGTVENFADLYEASSLLIDCYSLAQFDVGPRLGTFDSCGIRNPLDYIFISQSLTPALLSGTVFRKGLWGKRKTRPDNWET